MYLRIVCFLTLNITCYITKYWTQKIQVYNILSRYYEIYKITRYGAHKLVPSFSSSAGGPLKAGRKCGPKIRCSATKINYL